MGWRFSNGLRVLGLCLFASVLYGIAHDLMSTQVCLEYFTEHHPRIVATENPFLLAFVWGFWATWWVGFMGGCGLALVSNYGARQPLPARALVRPMAFSLALLLATAALVWIAFYLLGTYGPMIAEPSRTELVPELDRRLVASAVAHLVSYGGSVVVALGLAIWVDRARRRLG